LSYGRRQSISLGALPAFIEGFEGGLKGVVQAERAERRPAPRPDRSGQAVAALRRADPIAYLEVPGSGGEEFVLLIARRQESGRVAVVAPVASDKALVERALRKAVI
jgi:hypothetical protein